MNYIRLQIAKKIARKTFKKYHGHYPEMLPEKEKKRFRGEDHINKILGSYRKTKVPCSCPACGNPRKYFGIKTRQEVKTEMGAKLDNKRISHDHAINSPLWL